MSSILKALRKIEEEKRIASHAAPDLRLDQGNSVTKSRPLLPLIAGVVLGAVCVGLFFLWTTSDTPVGVRLPAQQPEGLDIVSKQNIPTGVASVEKMQEPPQIKEQDIAVTEPASETVAEALKVREVVMPAEELPVASVHNEPIKQAAKIAPQRETLPLEVLTPKIAAKTVAKVSKPAPLAVKPAPLAVKPAPLAVKPAPLAVKPAPLAVKPAPLAVKPAPLAVKPAPLAVKPETLAVKPETLAVKPETLAVKPETLAVKPETLAVKPEPLPDGILLKVSETFYHEDPANSMAVVNDLPVMIGTFVDTAAVLEIHADKVVFKIGDKTYDVPVSPPQ